MGTKVGRKGLISIPKPLREKYEIEEGSEVLVADYNGHIAILPLPKNPAEESWGILRDKCKQGANECVRSGGKDD